MPVGSRTVEFAELDFFYFSSFLKNLFINRHMKKLILEIHPFLSVRVIGANIQCLDANDIGANTLTSYPLGS